MKKKLHEYNWTVGSFTRKLPVFPSSTEVVFYVADLGNQMKNEDTVYLHRNGSIHQTCGDPGFYKSDAAAREMFAGYLPDNLFEL